MKRKIAVLLSAMMVVSAMPMTASAADLKSSSVVNAGFGKVGSTIDANADKYTTYNTVDQLKSRESVLKIDIQNKDTSAITGTDGRFKVTLTNGTFGDLSSGNADNSVFGYKNTVSTPLVITKTSDSKAVVAKTIDGKKVSYISNSTANKADAGNLLPGAEVPVSTLTGAFKVVSESGAPVVKGMIADDGTFIDVATLNQDTDVKAMITDLEAALKTFTTTNITTAGNAATSGNSQLKNGETQELNAMISATAAVQGTVDTLGTKLKAVYKAVPSVGTEKVLPQIPYTITIDSENEATITPKVTIENSWIDVSTTADTEVKSLVAKSTVDNTNLSMEIYQETVANSDTTEAKAGIAGGEEIAKIGDGTTKSAMYVKLCPKLASTSASDTSNGLIEADATTVATVEAGKPYIALPLGGVKVSGDGAVKAVVSSDYSTKVTGGEYTLTKGTSEGSTSLVYPTSSVKTFDESTTLDNVTIRENVRGTIVTNNSGEATFTLKLNSGFKFNNTANSTTLTGLAVKDASGANTAAAIKSAKYVGDGQSTIEVVVSGLTNRTSPIGLAVSGLQIAPVNSKNYGDVELTVSGNGIDTKTITVAKRQNVGFKLETVKDPTEIVAGRTFEKDSVNMDEQDNQTVEVKFSELVPGSLISSRSLDFNVPEGVKIVNADISEGRNITAKDGSFNENEFEIINNGKTLRLKANSYTVNSNNSSNAASFKIKFELSVDPSFEGDIKCNVTGGGQGSDATVETVIAKAIAPFKIETKNTKVNLGYQDYNTADIVITEAKAGMFLEGKNVELSLKAPFTGNTIGFSEAKYEISGGELEVKDKDFKVSNDKITFKINRSSTKNPSTITIKDVKIGSTRSVPFGSYNLAISGNAVINNYADTDATVTVGSSSNKIAAVSNEDKTYSLNDANRIQLANQDDTSYFEIKDYVNVVTETGTFNETVKVTVGEKTVVVGGQTMDMDVAPYIQASSNSTMVPLRFVAVALGVDTANVGNPDASSKVAWDANSKTVTIYYGAGTGQKIIQFQAGSNIMTVDGTRIPMEYGVVAEIKEGRMFVPFRALGQALGVTVNWDADTKTAIYNENNARNANVATTESTTATTTSTETTTTKESSTESTTAKVESTTETTTAKTN